MNVWGDECLKLGRGWWMSEVMNVGVMNVGQSSGRNLSGLGALQWGPRFWLRSVWGSLGQVSWETIDLLVWFGHLVILAVYCYLGIQTNVVWLQHQIWSPEWGDLPSLPVGCGHRNARSRLDTGGIWRKGGNAMQGNLTFAGGGSSVHAWAHGGQWTKCEERSDQVGPDPESWRNYKVGEVLGTSWLVDRFPDFTFMRVMQQKNCFLLNAFIYPTFWNDQLGLNSFFSGTSHGLARPPHTR